MMKKNVLFILLLGLLTSFIFAADEEIPAKNSIVFLKYESAWLISNDNDLEKKVNDVKEKKLFNFGNKFTVVGNKKIKDKVFLNVVLPDKTKLWGPLDYFTEKFITITENDLKCYSQPDEGYVAKNKLQPGYFGYFITAQNEWVKVKFISYVPGNTLNDKIWIGDVWIKSGYTDDVKTAQQGYALALAYNGLYGKTKDVNYAIKKLQDGITNVEGGTTITYILEELLTQLKEDKKVEMKVGSFYAPNVTNLRFRQDPTADGVVIRNLVQGEKLKLLVIGEEETINDIKGVWGKFETEKGEIGWCFSAYLSPVK